VKRLHNISYLSNRSRLLLIAAAFVLGLVVAGFAVAQAVPYARTFPKTKEEADKALKELQAYAGQKLPIVEGFVATGDLPLNRFERAFYQFSIDLLPGTSGGTIVRVTAKITAWYADPDPSKSGYQVLLSNGRLELDLLDRLEETLGGKPAPSAARVLSNAAIQSPKPKIDSSGVPGNPLPSSTPSTATVGNTAARSSGDDVTALRSKREAEEKRMQQLNQELQSLQEIQRNQAHPQNLVVVKKSGTPVLARPAEGSRVLFTALAEDEFEFLDAEGEWIHVQISGASRGYIRHSSLELPELIEARLHSPAEPAEKERPAVFRVAREETTSFPGDWEPLKGKLAKIYTVQPISQDPKETGPRAKLSFAVSLFQKFPAELSSASPAVDGVVVIFDSADGGIVGATLASVQQLANGSVAQESFWKQCYLDPTEAFLPSAKH
jgi:hypothetical protein